MNTILYSISIFKTNMMPSQEDGIICKMTSFYNKYFNNKF